MSPKALVHPVQCLNLDSVRAEHDVRKAALREDAVEAAFRFATVVAGYVLPLVVAALLAVGSGLVIDANWNNETVHFLGYAAIAGLGGGILFILGYPLALPCIAVLGRSWGHRRRILASSLAALPAALLLGGLFFGWRLL